MSMGERPLVDLYDDEDKLSLDSIIKSLTSDFPKSIKNLGDISKLSVRSINSMLYDEVHSSSHERYIECLQKFVNNPSSYDEDSIHETIETCLTDVESLYKRVCEIIVLLDSNNTVSIVLEDNPRDTASHLENRLSAIVDRAKLIQFTESETRRFKETVERFQENLSASAVSVTKLQEELSDSKDNVEKLTTDLSAANKDMVAVMGVFTSIIVVVMSLVITSSSWLNNASGASAIIAFIIPSCVAVLAVCALTFFLRLLINSEKGSYTPWIVIASLVFVLGCVSIVAFGKKQIAPHNRLVFEVNKYAAVDPNNVAGERTINIHFTEKVTTLDGEHDVEVVIDNQKESDCLIHNGLIYYCITHNRFE